MTQNQNKLLEILDDNGWDIFSHEMLLSKGTFNEKEIASIMRSLLKNGNLIKIEKGKYRRRAFTEENVIACFLAKDACIAYWSALNMHGLTEQFPNILFVQNSERFGNFKINGLGTNVKLIKVKSNKITGQQINGYGNHVWRITDVEKTIVDCFDLVSYSGTYPVIIKAVNRAKLDVKKLITYCENLNNHSVTRRLAFLFEKLRKPKMEPFIKYALSRVNDCYILFEPGNERSDVIDPKWRMNVNISEADIFEMAYTVY